MATASSMILRALAMNGEKPLGGTLTSNEQTAYLSVLNAMLDSWSLERLMVPNLLQESFPLSATTASYTIGPGGTFNTIRPTKIVDPCFIRDATNFDRAMGIIDAVVYGRFVAKGTSGSYPNYLFYDSSDVAGLGTIYLYPAPQAGLTLYINSWKQIQSFADVSTVAVLPPGYQRAIESNLCIELSAGGKSVQPEVAKIAKDSKANVMRLTEPDAMMTLDYGIVGGFGRAGSNIFTGG